MNTALVLLTVYSLACTLFLIFVFAQRSKVRAELSKTKAEFERKKHEIRKKLDEASLRRDMSLLDDLLDDPAEL